MKALHEEVLKIAKISYKENWRSTSNVSKATRSAIKVSRYWQENVVKLDDDDRYESERQIPGLGEKIDLVDLKEGIAYEMKVSGKNPHHEFYKNIFKVLVCNQKTSLNIQKLVFITENDGAVKLNKGLGEETIQLCKKLNLSIEIPIGF